MTLQEASERWVLALVSRRPNACIPQFLIHSYRYYVMDSPVVGDECFDFVARKMIAEWESLSHPHKGLVDPSLGKTGYYLKEAAYPSRTVHCALEWETLLRRATLGKA